MQAAATAFAQGTIVKNTEFYSEKYLKAVNAAVHRRLFFSSAITYFPSLSLLLFSAFLFAFVFCFVVVVVVVFLIFDIFQVWC